MRVPRLRAGSGVAGIGVAIGVASLAGYALLALVGKVLDPASFGLFVAFWGVLFGLGSSLSTIEQESARRAANSETETGPSTGTVTAAAAVLAVGAAALTLLPPVASRLYGDPESTIGLVVVVAAFGFAVQFAVRGVLIGSDEVGQYAGLVVAEALSRLVLLLVIIVAVGLTLPTAAVAVGVGSFAWVLWARRLGSVVPLGRPQVRTLGPALRRAASLMVAAALTASVITGYPTMVTALTDTPPGAAGGAVFAALTVSRIPLLLVSPIQALAVPAVVRWSAQGDGAPSPLRRMLVLGTGGAVLLAVVGGLVGALVGPWVVRVVYTDEYDVEGLAVGLLVASSCLLAWVLLLSAALVALSAYRHMIGAWAVAAGSTALWLTVSDLDVVATTAVGALVGPLAALAWALPALWSQTAAPARTSGAG
ncbi:hypothetical protein [Cellulomonas sp. NS3]|uniref:hypothetical protein n=1 Tax=Cellulomonas sp. NS3 TaxID=2973977 RepID=UPI0021620B66|nr:hypothetical protein [Cellulomonas sp. NS3]